MSRTFGVDLRTKTVDGIKWLMINGCVTCNLTVSKLAKMGQYHFAQYQCLAGIGAAPMRTMSIKIMVELRNFFHQVRKNFSTHAMPVKQTPLMP